MNLIRRHSCVLDFYANALIEYLRTNLVGLHVYRWFKLLYKQHFINKAVKFIPELFWGNEKLSAVVDFLTRCRFMCFPIEDLELVCSLTRWYRCRFVKQTQSISRGPQLKWCITHCSFTIFGFVLRMLQTFIELKTDCRATPISMKLRLCNYLLVRKLRRC